ncbi:hypothetical protein [Mesomycoplasma ovipneumoniae]
MKSKITKAILLLSSFVTVFGVAIACGTTPEIKTPAKQNENAKPLPKKPNLDNQNNLSSDKKEEQNNSTSRRDNEQIKIKTEDKTEEENQKSEKDLKNTTSATENNASQTNNTSSLENNTNSKTSKKTQLTLFEQQQQDSIEKISKLSTISSSFKHFFAEQVSEQKSTQDLKKLEEKFNKISNSSAKLKEIIESANFAKTTPKYTSTTNNVDKLLDITLLKAQSFFHNNQLAFSDNIDNLEVQINGIQNEIIRLQNELNGNTSEENIKNIEQAINDVNPSFDDEKISTYELQDKLNPAAFDVETTKLLTKIEKEGYTFEIKDTNISQLDNNKLEITYQVKDKNNHRARVTKTLDFHNKGKFNIESKIKELDKKFNSLDDLYEFDKIKLSQIQETYVNNLQDFIKENFRSKGNRIDQIFKHNLGQISYKNKHFSAQVHFLMFNKVVKTLELKSNVEIELRTKDLIGSEKDRADLELLISSYLTNKEWSYYSLDASQPILKDLQPIKQDVDHHGIPSMLALQKLNKIYKWPQIGKYSLFVKEVPDNSNIYDSNRGGTAKLIFGIKKDNQELNFQDWNLDMQESEYKTKYAKNMWYFRPLRASDIELPSNWVSSNFDNSHKKLIDEINASNFDLRKTPGAKVNGKETLFSVLNPQQLVRQFGKQDAGSALQYLLKLKNNHNNTTQNDSSEFKRTLDESKDATGGDEFDKQSIQAKIDNSANVFVVNTNSIIPSGVTTNPNNISDIINDYFIVYYDVKSERTGELKFKIGFINKSDPSKVYSKSEEITLVNLSNDFQNNIYPELLINKVSLQDFQYNNQQLTWNKQTLTLNNYSIDTKDITIHEEVQYKNNTYINLKYTYPNQKKKQKK